MPSILCRGAPGGSSTWQMIRVRSSLHQVDENLPSTALVRRSEQNAQDVALTELLQHFP